MNTMWEVSIDRGGDCVTVGYCYEMRDAWRAAEVIMEQLSLLVEKSFVSSRGGEAFMAFGLFNGEGQEMMAAGVREVSDGLLPRKVTILRPPG